MDMLKLPTMAYNLSNTKLPKIQKELKNIDFSDKYLYFYLFLYLFFLHIYLFK